MSEYVWKKQEAEAVQGDHPENIRRVLLLYTGGTIGMKWTKESGYQPAADYMESKLRASSMLHDTSYVIPEEELQHLYPFQPLALPLTFHRYRIIYCVHEYQPLLDSSNMSMEDWAKIARDIQQWYLMFDAFVILHGTDTMCYTASALSFMCENLGKTVVITGSQVPLSELRNDGRDNVLGAMVIAGQYVIQEVTVYFHNKLYRGNRSTKMNSASFEAFRSPNLPPLATVGIDINIEWDAIYRPVTTEKFRVHTDMDPNVGILRIFPGITAATVRAFLQPPMKGVVLQTYGAGNLPDINPYLLNELKKACERNMVVVNCSQCTSGHVTQNYAAGRKLAAVGVIPGSDMTTEAALTKLSYLLGKKLSIQEVKEHLVRDLRGEKTVLNSDQHQFSLRDSSFLRTVAQALGVSSSKEVKMIRQVLFPPMLCAAAASGNMDNLVNLHQQVLMLPPTDQTAKRYLPSLISNAGGDFSHPDYDGRTPLHLACSEGHREMVKYLLHHGASVHVRDRFNHTPLYDAVRFKRFDVIKLMVQTGAHLTGTTCEIATKICQAACEDDVDALRAWQLAGADLSSVDYMGFSALQVAVQKNSKNVINFLTRNGLTNEVGSKKQTGVPVKCNSCCVPGLSVENEESSTSRDMTRGVLPYMNGLDPESTNSESSMN